jgi:hypothetical protein
VRVCAKGGVKGANKQVDDVTGKGTTVRSCVKAANTPRKGRALANCISSLQHGAAKKRE